MIRSLMNSSRFGTRAIDHEPAYVCYALQRSAGQRLQRTVQTEQRTKERCVDTHTQTHTHTHARTHARTHRYIHQLQKICGTTSHVYGCRSWLRYIDSVTAANHVHVRWSGTVWYRFKSRRPAAVQPRAFAAQLHHHTQRSRTMARRFSLGAAILGTKDSAAHVPDAWRAALLKALDGPSRASVAQSCKSGWQLLVDEWPEAELTVSVRASTAERLAVLMRRLKSARQQVQQRRGKPTVLVLKQCGDLDAEDQCWEVRRIACACCLTCVQVQTCAFSASTHARAYPREQATGAQATNHAYTHVSCCVHRRWR